MDALSLLPAEIWMVVFGYTGRAADYRALALTCNGLAALARDPVLVKASAQRFSIKNGTYYTYYDNGWRRLIAIMANYSDNQLHGEYRSYYRDGSLESHLNYCRGWLDGEALEYHDNGKLRLSCTYAAGSRIGFRFEYLYCGLVGKVEYYGEFGSAQRWLASYDEEGDCRGARVHVAKRGTRRSYDYHDRLTCCAHYKWQKGQSECEYADESRRPLHGLYQEWYGNGQLALQVSYSHGQREGKFRSWYENGAVMQRGFYRDGMLIREWTEYEPKGEHGTKYRGATNEPKASEKSEHGAKYRGATNEPKASEKGEKRRTINYKDGVH